MRAYSASPLASGVEENVPMHPRSRGDPPGRGAIVLQVINKGLIIAILQSSVPSQVDITMKAADAQICVWKCGLWSILSCQLGLKDVAAVECMLRDADPTLVAPVCGHYNAGNSRKSVLPVLTPSKKTALTVCATGKLSSLML